MDTFSLYEEKRGFEPQLKKLQHTCADWVANPELPVYDVFACFKFQQLYPWWPMVYTEQKFNWSCRYTFERKQ